MMKSIVKGVSRIAYGAAPKDAVQQFERVVRQNDQQY